MHSTYIDIDSEAEFVHPSARGGVLTMPGGMKLIDSTLVIVLHNGEQEIERELASPVATPSATAIAVFVAMLRFKAIMLQGDHNGRRDPTSSQMSALRLETKGIIHDSR
jgi:hypothetical protein